MGKKNKKEKKGKGKEKTDQKAEKKAAKRSKKELADKGEEDIEKLIAQFQEEDKRRKQVIEEKCAPPSPRCNMSLVAHPEKDELLMFGGEYFTGNKMFVYNDLFGFSVKKNEWSHACIPNAPPPRSAHQAVTVPHNGGQMWVFGGEFSSHSQSQFYHYKDLWLLELRDKKWEQIKAPGGPSARSGHRMAALKKQIFVFGGFHDNSRDYKYFNDIFAFDLETYTWVALKPSGSGPSPRSGCVLLPHIDSGRLLIYGGYSKERVKRDVDKGTTHTDMFALCPEKKREDAESSDAVPKWKWQPMKQGGVRPSPRSGMSGVVVPGNKAFLFGGVFDQEDDDEDLEGMFYNELYSMNLENGKWSVVQLRKKSKGGEAKKTRRRKNKEEEATEEEEEENGEQDDEEMEITQEGVESLQIDTPAAESSHDSVFTVTQGVASNSSEGQTGASESDATMEVDQFWPSQRMNTALTYRDGRLFMYGGIFEEGDKQLTLADFYALDIHKQEEWAVIIAEDRKLQEWNDSGTDDDDDDGENEEAGARASKKRSAEEESSDDSDESMEITFDDAPARRDGEGIADYFTRSQDYWVQKAKEICEEDGESMSERKLQRFAKDLCEEACDS